MATVNQKIKVVTFGGGSGAPLVLKALALAGVNDVTAISASMDSGGRTGQMRMDERGRVISISDWLRNVMGLIAPQDNHLKPVETLLKQFDFTDGRGRNLGYLYSYLNLERLKYDFNLFQSELEQVLGINLIGRAYPVTNSPSNLCFRTSLGDEFCGEHLLDKYSSANVKIVKVWADPKVKAMPAVLKAIKSATHIIYSPGSLYGSLIACFLPIGISKALAKSKSTKILITNLISQSLESENLSAKGYFRQMKKYTRLSRPFSKVIIPKLNSEEFNQLFPFIAKRYRLMTNSHFADWSEDDLNEFKKQKVKVYRKNLFTIQSEDKIVRHDPVKLGKLLKQLL